MVAKPEGYVGAKTIPDAVALQAILDYQLGKGPWPNDALEVMGYPKKVAAAKLHKIRNRGWASQDSLTRAGLDTLERLDATEETLEYVKRRGDNV